jgi:tripartite-type tricarboxylate transporter receptor subunit TctC
LFAPAGTAPDIVGRINAETQKILADAGFRERSLDPYMFEPMSGSPAQFADHIRADIGKWDRVIRDANIKVE